jgi:hypothetical protein
MEWNKNKDLWVTIGGTPEGFILKAEESISKRKGVSIIKCC